jgi:16S rRNA (guanine527-N7)-methyltransferase
MGTAEDRGARLLDGARRYGAPLDASGAERLLAYLDQLLVVNEMINLTGVRDPEEAVERHLIDSLAFGLHAAEGGAPRKVVDLGTGGGFPGVPIAIAWPGAEVHLVDSTRKKVQAVQEILDALHVQNVFAHWSRAEDLRDVRDAGVVTARAVGPLAGIIRSSNRLLAPGGVIVAWKSEEIPEEERKEAEIQRLGYGMESLPDLQYELGRKRRLVRYRRRLKR